MAALNMAAQQAATSSASLSAGVSSTAGRSTRASCLIPTQCSLRLSSDFIPSLPSQCRGFRSASRQLQTASRRGAATVIAMSAGGKLPALNDLPLVSYISQQGRIVPAVEPGTAASVFAVLDKNKKVQYIGFSKDVRNSLRTLMGRRPELCFYYKLYNLATLDQQLMLDIRSQWFSEMGIPPAGNTDAAQRSLWERPADAGSISERGKAAAAQSMAKTLLQTMADRGLKELMEYDPQLIEEGKCDVLPSKEQSAEELAEAAAAQALAASRVVRVEETSPSGDVVAFDLTLEAKMKTNGGWMYDIRVGKDDKESRHRVIIGRVYSEAVGMPEDDMLARVMAFLLWKKLPRQTEGLLTSDMFPVNYFAVSEVAQKFSELKEWFPQGLPENYWRFNRIHSYGPEDAAYATQGMEQPQLFSPKY
eukprot:TRINITY_DN30857_c0_g1_i1.p1 TRINITY_DN30857_c0_g1~~TRINITY_DN30857_c0_g1_i1.p1  ORF type:complete len:420 (-),score=26.91 TRINITY_DN30857_c0_g1_i1:217-1476(-)